MTEVQDACGDHGHRHDGPGHGRGPGAGRPTRSRCTTRAPRRSSGPRRATSWPGACSTGSRRRRRGRLGALRERRRGRARGRRVRDRGHPREPRAQAAGLRRVRAARRAGGILASNTSGIPATKIAANLRAPGAGRRHALVQPAAPHPDDRGGARRADEPGGRRRHVRARQRHRLLPLPAQEGGARLRREPRSCTRSCASASRSWTRASWAWRSWTSTSSGASATSSRSSRRCSCWTWRAWTSTPPSASYLNPDLSNAGRGLADHPGLVAQGRLGMKTKGGLFDYTDEEVGALRAQRAAASSWSSARR